MIPPTPVEVRSFLMQKGKVRKGKRDLAFIPIEDWSSPLRGQIYIEGSMELTIGGKPLLTRDMWDDIDFMWGLLVNTLEELAAQGSSTLRLSGMRLVLKRVRQDTLSVAVETPIRGGRTAAGVEERNFYAHMISAGEHFFRRLEDLQADGGFQQDLRRLEALRARVLN
ncbi:hypothetical protein IDM40_27155 [Nocardiopsis sp. HNM0947]|uniref:SCP2 domain-containing protein n=1 Tax=Nocardiopsis coralli TaxID=2772213 RepID=A0ABR9PET4_9ACTN|nr:hypothetical protein [Nocardiopsis coralli]MBE3002348.1 hypothetical protein [Nocardiopsis coralli]